MDFNEGFALRHINVDTWNLTAVHSLLPLPTPHSVNQTALLQLLAVATPPEDAADIWDAWDAALSGPGDPPLPIGFRQSAINTLRSLFTDPDALNAQLNDLSNWARVCVPNNVFAAATESLDMGT